MSPTRGPFPGTLHNFSQSPHLIAFEHPNPQSTSQPPPPPPHTQNILLFLGGLGDGLLHPQYTTQLSTLLPSGWRLIELQLSSSNTGWTTSNLVRDADEVASAVLYFRDLYENAKVVLMGHSTGCQISMEYLTFRSFFKEQQAQNNNSDTEAATPSARPPISGIILQAGVSDRESLSSTLSPSVISSCTALARKLVSSGAGTDILPSTATHNAFGPTNPSAARWLSLVDYNGGDDYFSSDLPDEELDETFGRVGEGGWKVLVLLGAEDEYMPQEVDKEGLVGRWAEAIKRKSGYLGSGSGVVPRATHGLDGEAGSEVVEDVAARVGVFLGSV